MSDSNNLLAWPTCTGYVTVRPLTAKSPRKVWLMRRDSDQSYMVLKLSSNAESICSLRQKQVESARKYVIDFYGTLSTQLGEGILMEYCPGGSLAQLLEERSAFSLGECITALAPIAQTLAVLHSSGQIHGDVSASNVLLTADGMPKLGDFQEARTGIDQTPGSGTPGFMAPEVSACEPEGRLGEQDVYSLGACLWFLLEGTAPPEPNMRPPVTVIFPAVPILIHELLLDSLHQDPLQRPTAEQFARTLFAAAQAEPINWEQCTPVDSTHLMATIHPGDSSNRLRRKRPVERKVQKIQNDGGTPVWRMHDLRRTPGRAKVYLAVVGGVALIGASFLGVNLMGEHAQSEKKALSQAQEQPEPCRIQDGAVVPACAFSAETVIASFIKLSHERDVALDTENSKALSAIYPPASEQLQRDRQTLERLDSLELKINGLSTRLEDISVTARARPDTVILSATSTQEAYDYVDSENSVIHQVARGTREHIEVELKLIEGKWKIGKVISRSA
ncbi:serine/threonine protein kinase [Glutamicibacter arilaitensis]|uniref:serine/threonine protein kinase n=1 Tax=Glutamicibacter arilaitensis TaxID=256701 RepID=UPI00384AAA1D